MTIYKLIKDNFKEIDGKTKWLEEGINVELCYGRFNGQIYGIDIDNEQDLLEEMPKIIQNRRDNRIYEILS